MRVRAKSSYIFVPSLLDLAHPCSQAHANSIVRVVNLPNAPKCNTMGQCHIETLAGEFLGMVSTKSLFSIDKPTPKPRKKKMR